MLVRATGGGRSNKIKVNQKILRDKFSRILGGFVGMKMVMQPYKRSQKIIMILKPNNVRWVSMWPKFRKSDAITLEKVCEIFDITLILFVCKVQKLMLSLMLW